MEKEISLKELIALAKKEQAVEKNSKHELLYGRLNSQILLSSLNYWEEHADRSIYLNELMLLKTTQTTIVHSFDGIESEDSLYNLMMTLERLNETIRIYKTNKTDFIDQDEYNDDLAYIEDQKSNIEIIINDLTESIKVKVIF